MAGQRAVDAFVVWALSIILAAIFLLAGVPKLLGMGTVGLQAAAMRGFPDWIRIVVGVVEVVGAVMLLIPTLATFAALALAVVMVPATLTQFASGEGGIYVPIALLAALLFVAWRRNPAAVRDSYRQFADRPHPLLRDGVIAGFIGAATIAVWFFVIDLISGRPLFTPTTLGRALVAVLGPVPEGESAVIHVLAYSVFHFAAFMLVGLVAALIVFLAQREPSILFGFLVLFVTFEVGFHALVGLLEQATPLGAFAWYQVMVGNLLAAAAMGFYFWRTHKELAEEFRHSLDWDTELLSRARRPDAEPAATAGGPAPEGDGHSSAGGRL